MSQKVSSVEIAHNLCYRPLIRLSNMCFGMRKARPIHLRYENYVFKHFNCLEIGRNVAAGAVLNCSFLSQEIGADVCGSF